MKTLAPSSSLLEASAGSLLFTIPIVSVGELAPFFEIMHSTDSESPSPALAKLRSLTHECGISQTSLQEVFLLVTGRKAPRKVAPPKELYSSGEMADNEASSSDG